MPSLYTSTTLDAPPGYRVERSIGACWGALVNSVGAVRGLVGSFKSLRAGEVTEYSQTLDQARHLAVERMMQHAASMGANAVLGVRFSASKASRADENDNQHAHASEIVAYGTAAVLVADPD